MSEVLKIDEWLNKQELDQRKSKNVGFVNGHFIILNRQEDSFIITHEGDATARQLYNFITSEEAKKQ